MGQTTDKNLREITFDFDVNYGDLYYIFLTIKNISIKLNGIAADSLEIDKTNIRCMSMAFYDHYRTIEILAALLHYTTEDFCKRLRKTESIKDTYFEKLVKGNNADEEKEDKELNGEPE